MTRKLLSFLSILAFGMTLWVSSHAQETRPGSDLRDIDPGLAKQIARDKQLLEIWKEHVRKLTRERDEAYHQIEELKSTQTTATAEPVIVQDTAALETALQDKEAAFREAEALRAQVTTLKGQISRLEVQGANQQFAVEVQPNTPGQNPGSQKFYADLTKNYMLQQESIKKLKAELARLETETETETENAAASREELQEERSQNEGLQRRYQEAMDRIQALESETQELSTSSKGLEVMLSQVRAEKARLSEEIEKARGLEGEIAQLKGDQENLEKDYRQALDEIEEFESQKALFKQEITKLSSENQSIRNEYDTAIRHTDDLKLRAQSAETELQKTNANNRALQELIEKLKAEAQALSAQKAAADQSIQELNLRLQDQTARSKETENGLRNALAQSEESVRQGDEIREDLTAQNDALKEKLNSNAADVKNLKENFETMLEPLVSSFDDRKKVV